ncbi:hypothetical protein DFH09DRAFT_1103670 [Mycena vulgaris]|nr:hypothetical protein DFH09DRAFT_1103670 [Mycena vulgaris]
MSCDLRRLRRTRTGVYWFGGRVSDSDKIPDLPKRCRFRISDNETGSGEGQIPVRTSDRATQKISSSGGFGGHRNAEITRQQFPGANTRRSDLALGTIDQFAHLPSNSLLALLPNEENGTEPVKIFSNHVEISLRGYKLFETLMGEKMSLCKAVASLNTVRRKGKTNISLIELPEDDAVAE